MPRPQRKPPKPEPQQNNWVLFMPIINGRYYANPQYGTGLERARAADAGSSDQSGRKSLVDQIADWISPQPPPPASPTPPPAAPEAYDDATINELRVRQVASIVANENHDVTPGKSSPEHSQNAKIAQAHAIINADRYFGPERNDRVHTAPNEVTPELENSPQYQQALDAARTAFQEQLAGKDRVQGRMWFNHRYNDYLGRRHLGDEYVDVAQHFGPFQLGNQTVYTAIDNNPKNMPKPYVKR
jgi:hypothetical protein